MLSRRIQRGRSLARHFKTSGEAATDMQGTGITDINIQYFSIRYSSSIVVALQDQSLMRVPNLSLCLNHGCVIEGASDEQ